MTGYNPSILGDFSELFPKKLRATGKGHDLPMEPGRGFQPLASHEFARLMLSPPCRCRFRGAAFSIFVVERNHGHFFDPWKKRWGG